MENLDSLITDNLDINSMRNKFEAITEIIKEYNDVCKVSETRVHSRFPVLHFKINGCKNFKRGWKIIADKSMDY